MSDTAVNAPVVSEGKIESGGHVSWDDLEKVDIPDAKVKPEPKKPSKEKTEARSAPKPQPKAQDDADSDEEDSKKPQPKKTKDEAKGEDDPSDAEKAERKPKPKVHKIRSGDQVIDLSGDSLVPVEIDGKKEDVSLEELRSNYSGKVYYDKKLTALDKERKEHKTQVDSMNTMVTNLVTKAKENPDEGLDFLAELVGQDPVDFKEKMVRAQIAEVLPLLELSEDEREQWIKDKVRDWRDKKYERRDQAEKESKVQAETKAKLDKVKSTFGLDDDTYESTERALVEHLKKTGQPTDVSPGDVVFAHRYLLAADAVKEVVPHLESHGDYDKILMDVARHMIDYPQISTEKLKKLLAETYGIEDEKAALKRLSKKAQAQAESSGDDLPQQRKKSETKDPMFFDEL